MNSFMKGTNDFLCGTHTVVIPKHDSCLAIRTQLLYQEDKYLLHLLSVSDLALQTIRNAIALPFCHCFLTWMRHFLLSLPFINHVLLKQMIDELLVILLKNNATRSFDLDLNIESWTVFGHSDRNKHRTPMMLWYLTTCPSWSLVCLPGLFNFNLLHGIWGVPMSCLKNQIEPLLKRIEN